MTLLEFRSAICKNRPKADGKMVDGEWCSDEITEREDDGMMFGRKKQKRIEARWRVFNIGTDLEFAECSNCGHEMTHEQYDEYDMPQRCSQCGADIVDVEYPD